jgi:hypothetical protein
MYPSVVLQCKYIKLIALLTMCDPVTSLCNCLVEARPVKPCEGVLMLAY